MLKNEIWKRFLLNGMDKYIINTRLNNISLNSIFFAKEKVNKYIFSDK